MSFIDSVRARAVWDSRGCPTVEAEVRLDSGVCGLAIAPAGASTGAGEARELRDGGSRLKGLGVDGAVRAVNEVLAPCLQGMDITDQAGIDAAMCRADGTADKSRLGANGITAVSLACLWAASRQAQLPLWRHLSGTDEVRLPLPQIQIFGGGAHAKGSVDVQDFLAVPHGASSFAQSLEWVAEVYHAAGKALSAQGKSLGVADEGGFWPQFGSNEGAIEALVKAIEAAGLRPGRDVSIALDLASTQYFAEGIYHWRSENRRFDRDQLLQLYTRWVQDYPIVSMEDGFAEDDIEGMQAMTQALGHKLQIVGDDFFVTKAPRIAERAAQGACNAVLIKPNQVGTVSETRQALEASRAQGMGSIVSARSGETEDVSIVHLAVGWGVAQLKVGSFARSERMAKWNEGLRIEQDLGCALQYPHPQLFPWLKAR
jgi:enolase